MNYTVYSGQDVRHVHNVRGRTRVEHRVPRWPGVCMCVCVYVCVRVRICFSVFLSPLFHFISIILYAIFFPFTSLFDNHVHQYNHIPNLSCVYLRVRAIRWRVGRRIRGKARTGLYLKQGTYVLCTACTRTVRRCPLS